MKERIGSFEKNSIIVILFSGITGVLGYAYHLLLGNLMSVADYGKANAYISYISLLSIFISPLAIFASKKIAEFGRKNKELLNVTLAYVYKITLFFLKCIIIVDVILIACKGRQAIFYIVLSITVVTNILYTILLLMIQGFNDFILYSVASLVNVLFKIILSSFLIVFGVGMNSVFGGIIAGNVFAIGLMLHSKYKDVFINHYKVKPNKDIKTELQKYYQWGFLAQTTWAFIGNGGDVILIQKVCSSYQAGLYSVMSSIVRIGLFLVTSISAVMFPQIAAYKENYLRQKKYLLKTCIYGSVLMIIYLMVFNILKIPIVQLLYGEKYLEGTDFAFSISVFALLIAIGGILYQFFLANGCLKKFAIINSILILVMIVTTYFMKADINLYLWIWNIGLFVTEIVYIRFVEKGEKNAV